MLSLCMATSWRRIVFTQFSIVIDSRAKQNGYLQSTIHENTVKSDSVKRTNLIAPMIKPAVLKSMQKQHVDTLGILWINPLICSILKIKYVFHLQKWNESLSLECISEAREIHSNDKQNGFLMKIYSFFIAICFALALFNAPFECK